MKIVVMSCDKNEDLFVPFHKCMEKYWKDHPEIIYITETIENPFYKTICKNYEDMEVWTKKIRESIKEIDDDKILLIVDDLFIRDYVDTERIKYVEDNLKGNIALFNFEKSYDSNDIESQYEGFKKRDKNGMVLTSLMCGMWQKDKLLTVLNITCQPWEIERLNIGHDFEYYINSGEWIINFGYVFQKAFSITRGKWAREIIPFFEKEGIEVDYSERGFYD